MCSILRTAFSTGLLLFLANAPLLPVAPADAGDPVEIRQRIGLRPGTSHGSPVTGRVDLLLSDELAVSGDSLFAPIGIPVQLAAAFTPEGCERDIQWQAPGGTPAFGTGAAFQTVYYDPTTSILRAVCGDASDSLHVIAYEVGLTRITFDWDPGASNDGVDIRRDRLTDVLRPEWIPGERNEPIAYLRETTPVIKARLTVDPPIISQLSIVGTAPAPWNGFADRIVRFSEGVSLPEEMPFVLLGSAPAAVDCDSVTISWKAHSPNGAASDATEFALSGPHVIYTLYATPLAPMSEPWSHLLDYTCAFAEGAQTEEGVVDSIISSWYWESDFIYQPWASYTTGYSSFNLTALLYDLDHADRAYPYLNCSDCGNFAHIQTNALGVSGEYHVIGYNFSTHYLRGVGTDYWRTWDWNYHQVGWFWNSMVGDFSAAYDGDEDPSVPPHSIRLLVGDTDLDEFLDLLTDDPWAQSQWHDICDPY